MCRAARLPRCSVGFRRRCGSITRRAKPISSHLFRTTATASIAGRRRRPTPARLLLRSVDQHPRRRKARSGQGVYRRARDRHRGKRRSGLHGAGDHLAERGRHRPRDRRGRRSRRDPSRARSSAHALSARTSAKYCSRPTRGLPRTDLIHRTPRPPGGALCATPRSIFIAAGDAHRGRRCSPRASSKTADTMTDEIAALGVLARTAGTEREDALEAFYARHARRTAGHRQMVCAAGDDRRKTVRSAGSGPHGPPAFSLDNPNRVRSLIGVVRRRQSDPVQRGGWQRL